MLQNPILLSFISVIVISFISLIGIFFLGFKQATLQKFLLYLISFAAGSLMGDVFLHLLPQIVEKNGWTIQTSLAILAGIGMSLILEKIIHWRHCHLPVTSKHTHHLVWMNLFGDGIHNFIDGVVIAASFMVSLPAGLATSLAVLLHEIPQEIGDYSVLIHGGLSRKKALSFNFLTALTAIFGAGLAWWLADMTLLAENWLVPFAAGSFIYIAGSDLIPEMHKEPGLKSALGQIISFGAGAAVMALMLLLE